MKDNFFAFGADVAGYQIRVFNERQVRAAAGILFLLGFAGFSNTLYTENLRPMQAFAVLFLLDMFLRLFISVKISPTMLIAKLFVYRQTPEWVGAPQKRVAWGIGLGLAMLSCASLGLLALPVYVALVLCGICLSVLFLETAFGICIGCEVYRLFSKSEPLYCPGNACSYKKSA